MHVAVENLRNAKRLGPWLVFGVSTAGDMWLLHKDPGVDKVAFLPQEVDAGEHPVPLGIGLHEWFELALYVRNHEAAKAAAPSDANRRNLKQRAKKFLEQMSPALAAAYPYELLLWWGGRLGVWAWLMRVEFTRRADGVLHVVWLEPGARVERVVLLVDVLGVEVEASPIGMSQLVLVLTAKKRIVVATSTAVEGLGTIPAELRRFLLGR